MQGVVCENGKYRISKDSFIHLCERNTGVPITNLARFGHKITDGEKVIRSNLSRIDNPEVKYVLLEYGGNDCDFNWKGISDFPEDEHPPATDILKFSDTYLDIIDLLRSRGKQPVLLSLPPINPDMYFARIHPNESGHRLIAHAVMDRLYELVLR